MRSSAEQRVVTGTHHLTVRGLAVGLAVGLVICCSNMYFGLQTGFISTMSLPSSLLGFGIFKALARHLSYPFSPVENVLVQSVAGSMAIAPLGSGFVGVLPAMKYLLTPDEHGPIDLSLIKMIFWSLGLCYFGVLFAVPLRRQVIIREKLKFPSGFSTAVLISVLHGRKRKIAPGSLPADFASLAGEDNAAAPPVPFRVPTTDPIAVSSPAPAALPTAAATAATAAVAPPDGDSPIAEHELRRREEWRSNLRLLLVCFLISGLFTLATYFLPIIRNLPIFGYAAAHTWLWTFNPSLAYIGQGVIMGPETTMHMLLGAFVGWAILSPLAKHHGWAPGPIDDWESGSKGWIVWISIAIMLADGVVSLTHVSARSAVRYWPQARSTIYKRLQGSIFARIFPEQRPAGYIAVSSTDDPANYGSSTVPASPASGFALPDSGAGHDAEVTVDDEPLPEYDAPPEQQIGARVVTLGLVLSILFCIACTRFTFGPIMPLYATVIAILMALVLSIMGVRALGETDLNPVSGISKLTQLFFALIVPGSHKYSVLINLIAGAVSEAGALQAGELMQDLKTGHLLGAAPSAQFWGQVIGTSVGAIVSAFLYRLYTTTYEIPSDLFQIPTGYVWIFTARLVTGKGLPAMAGEWAIGAAILFSISTLVRIHTVDSRWHAYIPGGIAIAIGMYNVPSFTLARSIGGLISFYWRLSGRDETQAIVLSSGFILGEGFLSVVNLVLQSAGVPHL